MIKRNNIASTDIILASSVRITHPERVVTSTATITKGEIANYYDRISSFMLPYVRNRPIVLFRCPDRGKCFYQKHYTPSFPKEVHKIEIEETKNKLSECISIKNKKGLLSLIQFSTIEIHMWPVYYTSLEKPNMISFDLDPDPTLPWKRVIEVALILREILEQLNLQSFVKTSGGKGLHIIVPLRKKDTWEKTKSFSHHIALYLSHCYPDLITINPLKSKRRGKIFIDYLRNGRGSLIVAPYSIRARKGAPISTPISWEELPTLRSGIQYHISNIMKRLSQLQEDPWKHYFQYEQIIPKI